MLLVFDLIAVGYRHGLYVLFGLVFVAVSVGLVILEYPPPPAGKKGARLFGWFFASFATILTAAFAISTYSEYAKLRDAMRRGETQFVEGPVEGFVPMPASGHAMERFEVHGKTFAYSDYVLSAGFNTTTSHGGPIRDGRRVRVGYIRDTIVRLEVAP